MTVHKQQQLLKMDQPSQKSHQQLNEDEGATYSVEEQQEVKLIQNALAASNHEVINRLCAVRFNVRL